MQLHVRVIEAKGIAKMDFFSKSDPYCILKMSSGCQNQRTRVIQNSQLPRWNEDFHFNIQSPATDYLQIMMYDEDVGKDEAMARITIQIASLPIGSVVDQWYDMVPAHGVKKGGRIHLITHVAERGRQPFMNYEVSSFHGGMAGAAQGMAGMAMGVAGMYPPPAYPGYPPPAYPGYPPQGYPAPPPGYAPQGYPAPPSYPPSYAPPGYPAPPPNYAPQGHPPQGYPPQGYPAPPPSYAPPGYPAPPQGYPGYH